MYTGLSDPAILKELGKRIREYRISQELKQSELAQQSGISLNTLGKIESGKPVSIVLFLSVLRSLGLLDNLELLVPEQRITPMQMLKYQGRRPKRVR